MGTWILNGTTVTLQDNGNTVGIGVATTTPQVKLEVVGNPARLTLQDKGGEVYDVKAYGAKGDGATDDRQAIQNAINDVPAGIFGIIYFPPGNYIIGNAPASSLIRIVKPVQLSGAGPLLSTITAGAGVTTKNMFHSTFAVTDPDDKVQPLIFRDLRFDATSPRIADAAILQEVPQGSLVEHGIRIENCHFRRQHIGVRLRGASTAVIENCTFWSTSASDADVWIDEIVGGDSTTHLITGCLFADTGGASTALKLTGGCGGDRVIGNYFINYDTQIQVESQGTTSMLIVGNLMEAARKAAVRMAGSDAQIHSVISGNTMRAAGNATSIARCILVDVNAAGAFVDQITVVANKFVGDMSGLGTKGIELAPTGGAAVDRWLIAENLFHRFNVGIEANSAVTGLMLGSNAYIGNAVNLVNGSTGSKGATFLDRVGIGAENGVAVPKELHIKSDQVARPRIYLEGNPANAASAPGIDFAFDSVNTRRAVVIGRAVGTMGVQLELFTKPDSGGPIAQRLVVDADGNAIWTAANFQEMIEVSEPAAPATGSKARIFMRANPANPDKTQFCVKFATGAVQVLATEP